MRGEPMIATENNQTTKEFSMKKYLAIAGLCASALVSLQAAAAQREGAVKDAWIDGRLESVYALNRHLNAFDIDTEVDKGVVQLTGQVQSDIDRDLAGELAKGIDGVVKVNNQLTIVTGAHATLKTGEDRSFGTWIDDTTMTARVKSKLIANPNTKAMQIHVDTRSDVVTLSGDVASAEEKALAEELARNTGDVKDVRNQLIVHKAP